MAAGADEVGFGRMWQREAVDAVNGVSGGIKAVVGRGAVKVGGEVNVRAEVPKLTNHCDQSLRIVPDFGLKRFGAGFG